MAGRFSVEAVFKAVDRVTAPISRMQNRVSKFTRSMERGLHRVNRSMSNLGDGIRKGAIATVAATALMTGAMADVIQTGAQFEQTLVNAAAKFPGEINKGTAAFKALEDAARQTGASTEFSASEAAGALNFLAMAGFDAESAIAALPGVVDLATAAQVDLATATDVASDSLGAFGLMSKDTAQLGKNLARVNDVIAKTTTSANTTVELMFETIKEGAPVATAAGASMETFAALTGELANAGIKGGKAGTVLKNMFIRLQAPVGKAAKVIDRLGISLTDQNGKLRDMPEIIGQFNKATKDMGASQKAATLQAVFGMEAIAGVNVLMQSGEERLKAYRTQLEAAEGASGKMAATMRDTLLGRFKGLMSAVEGVKVSIFSLTSGPMSDVIDQLTAWVRANGELIASNIGEFLKMIITNFESIVTWGKRIGIAIGVFIALTTVLKSFVLVMTVVNLLMAMNPVGLMVIGVLALVAGLTALVVWIDDIAAGFDTLPGIVQAILAPIGLLIDAIKWIKDNIGAITDISLPSMGDIGGFFGFGGDDESKPADGSKPATQMISPQERISRSIEEKKTSAEIMITDQTGSAQIANSTMGSSLKLNTTGGF